MKKVFSYVRNFFKPLSVDDMVYDKQTLHKFRVRVLLLILEYVHKQAI